MFFSESIFKAAEESNPSLTGAKISMMGGLIDILSATLGGVFLIYVGRKTLLFYGSISLAICLFFLGLFSLPIC